MLPRPGFGQVIVAKRLERRCHRPLPPRRPQPHIHLIQPAFGHRRGYRGDQRLGQTGIKGSRRKRARANGNLGIARVIDHDQIKVRQRIQPPRPQRPHAQYHRTDPRQIPVFARKFGNHHRPDRRHRRPGQIGILPRCPKSVDQPAQMMHADAEMPFLDRPAQGIELALIIRHRRHRRRQRRRHPVRSRPWRKETAADHRIEHPGVARQIARQIGGAGGDIDDQIDQLRVGIEQRQNLNAGGQALQKAVKLAQSRSGLRRFGQPRQQLWLDPAKDLHRPG